MKRTIRRLNRALRDPDYRRGWAANIAMAYIETEEQYRSQTGKKYLSRADRHIIANKAADNFLNLLKG